MPVLSYSVTDFSPLTKILSADVNSKFTSIKTLLNTTKLDSTNVQDAGLTVGKLSGSGGSAGQFVGYNGSVVGFVSNPLTATYNVVIGSAAQVTAGTATYSTYASYSAVAADGDRVLVLPGYATSEAWSITKKLYIQGLGNTSQIIGAITFASGAGNSYLAGIRTQNDITVNSSVTGLFVEDIWFTSTHTFVDGNSSMSNYLSGMQE